MRALITGASSGLGKDFAKELAKKGYELILVARRREKLEELAAEVQVPCEIMVADLSRREECFTLLKQIKDKEIDLLINNAGRGLYGEFTKTDLEEELAMLDLNIVSLHLLMKNMIKQMANKGGTILNVASSAAFLPGPLLSSYYASKAYVLRLTEAVSEELRRTNSSVTVCTLCPGPVDTEFDAVAGTSFSIRQLKSIDVVRYALRQMKKKKTVIVPGLSVRIGTFFTRFAPRKLLLRVSYHIQNKKR